MSIQMSSGVPTIEDTGTAPVDVPLKPGDHGRFSHHVEKDKLTETMEKDACELLNDDDGE